MSFSARHTSKSRTIAASVMACGMILLGSVGVAGCGAENDTLIGYWYPVEINGEPTVGSTIQLRLQEVNPETLTFTGYKLYIDCDDRGRLDEKRGVLISDMKMTGRVPQDECNADDPQRLDALRRMTHEGVSVRLDSKLFSATLSTETGQTARFDFMDMTPVD